MALISCPKCGEMISDRAWECPKCGEKLEPKFKCWECGEVYDAQLATCPNCGCPQSKNVEDHRDNFANFNVGGMSRQQIFEAYEEQTKSAFESLVGKNICGMLGFIFSVLGIVLVGLPGVHILVWFAGFVLSFIGVFSHPRTLAVWGIVLSFFYLILALVLFGTLLSLFAIFQ